MASHDLDTSGSSRRTKVIVAALVRCFFQFLKDYTTDAESAWWTDFYSRVFRELVAAFPGGAGELFSRTAWVDPHYVGFEASFFQLGETDPAGCSAVGHWDDDRTPCSLAEAFYAGWMGIQSFPDTLVPSVLGYIRTDAGARTFSDPQIELAYRVYTNDFTTRCDSVVDCTERLRENDPEACGLSLAVGGCWGLAALMPGFCPTPDDAALAQERCRDDSWSTACEDLL